MSKIEIRTAHNIRIQYNLATVWDRILSFAIDVFLLVIYISFVGILASSSTIFYYIFIFPVVGFYHLFAEMFFNGQSIGKKMLRIRVVSLQGQNPKKQDFLLRWAFRLVDITLTAGTCAIILILSGARNQRIGDLLSNTTVIKLEGDRTSSLSAIKQIGGRDYVVKFPALRSYNDRDMLLVKQALIRFQKHPTDDNRQLINMLAKDLATFLKLDIKQMGSKSKFLKQVLEDYIFLTR